jgi:hypothetical protein
MDGAGDGVQRLLVPRFRLQPRLTPSVDMTSDVKGCQPIFLGLHRIFYLGASKEPEPAICDG